MGRRVSRGILRKRQKRRRYHYARRVDKETKSWKTNHALILDRASKGVMDSNRLAMKVQSIAASKNICLTGCESSCGFQHQPLVASFLCVCLIVTTGLFSYQWLIKDGLVDIDRAEPIRVEFKVDINSAGLGEIVVLPGVGRKLAQAIIDHRQTSGGFESIGELCDVPGIGEKKLLSLEPHLLPIKPLALNK